MISYHRRRETAPFLAPSPLRDLGSLQYFHSTLRQGLFRFFSRAGRRRALIPDYAPQGVSGPLREAGLQVEGYPVGPDLLLDPAALKARIRIFRPDVFVYIHHFGVYLEENLAIVRETLGRDVLLVEDFAHSLPWGGVPVRGDVALFAPWKTLGLADGAMLWFRDGRVPSAAEGYGREDARSRVLASRLSAALAWEDFIARLRPPRILQTLGARALGSRVDAYAFLARHYRDIATPASPASRQTLEAVDFAAVHRRRRHLAALYLAGLEPRFRLVPAHEAYVRQSLLAFPIRVDDQDRFRRHLARRGIQGYRLTDFWLLDEGRNRPPIHRHHYLLPLGHHLEDAEIREVIACVNAYPGCALPVLVSSAGRSRGLGQASPKTGENRQRPLVLPGARP
jgi:hypothetical protein